MPIPLDPATLPRKVIALRGLLLQREAEHAAALEQQAGELQAARNGLQEQVLRNEQLKRRLAKLLRERFGASSEKLRGAIEQLELLLGELEEQIARRHRPSRSNRRRQHRARRHGASRRVGHCRRACRATWWNTRRPVPARNAAGPCVRSAKT